MRADPAPVVNGFRQRGHQVTRLETFVDAAFAFSLTMLVIMHGQLPDTIDELRMGLRRVPTFAACFVLLMVFWAAHNRWSRRFGLDDARSTVLSLALVLVVMVYVYPLRMVISSALHAMTGGWVPSELGIDTTRGIALLNRDLQTAFMVYAVGFGLLSWLIWQLNAHALRRADALGLSEHERYETRTDLGLHVILAASAAISLVLSLLALAWPWATLRGLVMTLPVWVYAALSGVMPWYAMRRGRRSPARLEER